MYRFSFILIFVVGLLISCQSPHKASVATSHLTDYVDPFVGTDGPGNTYPGAVVPFGMVQLSPDNGLPGWDRIAGYFWPDSTIAGFSHKHLTGTGAGDLYDILIMPYNSRFTDDLWKDQDEYRPYSKFSHERESASPGYYSVDLLSSGIKAELTATKRVGMHRYTFPKDSASKILIDLGYALNWDAPTSTYLKVQNDTTITGYRYSTGWAPDQREHFTISFSKPIAHIQLYDGLDAVDGHEVKATKTKAEITFATSKDEQVMIKVALSSHSIDGAENNLLAECPGWDFDKMVHVAQRTWERILSTVQIEGTKEQKTIFYTNLYHCFLTPSLHSDTDGWYKGADGNYHLAKGYNKYETFSLWDTYRTAHPLYTILVPEKVKDMVASFQSHFNETGLLPVWSFAGNETNMMIGYHSVPVIVDAFFKGIPMDTLQVYKACVETAKSDAWSLPDYKKYGYVPMDDESEGHWSVSKTLEYAYDDWCIAQFAKALNKDRDYIYFKKRADNWKNLFDEETKFFRPKNKKGEFLKQFDPKEYTEYFCESNAWHYFWHVQHDIPGLIDLTGKEAFTAKLDSMFTFENDENDELPIFSTGMIGQYAHGNEPSHHVAYLYNDLGQAYKTQEMVRKIITSQYSTKPDGYCGNEDCGQMSAWMVMSSLGVYPVNPANGVYSLTSPWFKSATINLSNGKQFVISTENQSEGNVYIQQMYLNGEELNDYTLTHPQIMNGGELHFVLGNQPKK
ncbi:GH92 family glycosyl hydrolase [Plebeiibacterium sediminum]|uniref:GH92 family glycosyl hydrolase n=1 Tax=Plebeiibacterium sediminum TaxID=2992112 RepID=A0AAE3M9D1_9BACT|nr:GH92 family glycosyl hydrolase [Plebeiobacterium sediminum]MCW3789010.1 GH92 family glycosyl hydrolase [Plebeiobacterium sediminum]